MAAPNREAGGHWFDPSTAHEKSLLEELFCLRSWRRRSLDGNIGGGRGPTALTWLARSSLRSAHRCAQHGASQTAKGFASDRTLIGMRDLESDLENLYRRRQGAFQGMVASLTGSVESARDVVQEAFAQPLRDRDGFCGQGSLQGWVWRIAFRVAIRSKESRELPLDGVPEVASSMRAGIRRSPQQCANCRHSVGTAIFLRYFADLSHAEIGEVLGIAEGTVAATLSKAHEQLGAELSQPGADLSPSGVIA